MTITNPITREHLGAMRDAIGSFGSLVFRFDFAGQPSGKQTCTLEANVRKSPGYGLDRIDLRVEIPVEAPSAENYSKHDIAGGCWVLNTDPHLATFVKTLRTGDCIAPRFIVGNESPAQAEAGITVDHCSASIWRPAAGKAPRLVGTYLLGVEVLSGPSQSIRAFRFTSPMAIAA